MSGVALLTPYAAPIPGGISSFVGGLRRTLERDGRVVLVLAGEGGSDSRSGPDLGHGPRFVRKALAVLSRERPEVVHAHGHKDCLVAGLKYLRMNPRARLVFSFHTTNLPRSAIRFSRLLRKAHVVTFVSAAQLAHFREILRMRGDLRILRPATDVIPVPPPQRAKWAAEHGTEGVFPILAFVGPLEYPEKVQGVIDLVRSLPRIQSQYPSARLFVLGDGSLRARVALEATRQGARVSITGFVSDPRPALALTDIYCHISYQEGLPIALLEAMSLACCCVASPTGGIPEVITRANGVLVRGGPEDVAQAVCDLAGNAENRRALGLAAQNTIQQHYTWETRLPQVREIYGWR